MATRARRGRGRGRTAVALSLALALWAGACTSDDDDSTSSTGSTTTTDGSSTTDGGSTSTTDGGPGPDGGVALASGIRLSKGTPQGATAEPAAIVDGEPLDDAAVQAVLDRLPEWASDDTAAQAFNWPAQTIQPPLPGQTAAVQFPSPDEVEPVEVPSGPLHVVRFQPEGDVDVAPFVSVTFDQPMVPIATVGQLSGTDVPATITPDIAGHWQWIGTKTLRFDADSDVVDRLPMATEFTVTIPAGTTSATGGELADAVTWQFATPPLTVQTLQPEGDGLRLSPVFVAAFDQRVDPAAVLPSVVVEAGGSPHEVRLATDAEIAADEAAQQLVDLVPEGRWLAFTPVTPFPTDSEITIEISAGAPSAEGPRTTTTADRHTGHTYEPLRVDSVECGYGSDCVPGSDFAITFNNALDLQAFDPTSVTIDPPIEPVSIGAYANSIIISGPSAPRTDYRITLPGGLTDVFGQQLGDDETHTITTGSPLPMLRPFTLPFTTLDPFAEQPSIPIVSVGHETLHLEVFAAEPDEWSTFVQTAEPILYGYGEDDQPTLPWPVLVDTTIEVEGDLDTATETLVDLSEALPSGLGQVIVLVEPTEQYDEDDPNYWMNRPTITWAQSTRIGLDAFTDADELRAWATDLQTGAPLAGVAIEAVGSAGSATTDEDGLATLRLSGQAAISATLGEDVAILPANFYFGGSGWTSTDITDNALWFVFDDRQIYRPGETVSIKGWVRRLTTSTDAQIALLGDSGPVSFTARDSQGNVLAEGAADLNPLGGFDLSFDIPAGANLGSAWVDLAIGVPGIPFVGYSHGYQIEEFRRPDFEVTTRPDSAGPYVTGEPITVAVDANYYAGGPLAAAGVDWVVTTASASYAPPGWDDFSFGVWTPWWYEFESFGHADEGPCCGPPGGEQDVQQYSGTTDAAGSDYLQIDVGDLGEEFRGLPVTVSAQATVEDVNRQALASSTDVLVHAGDLYVGLRSEQTFVRKGEPLRVDVVVTDIDGNAVPGRAITVTAGRSETVFASGQWTEQQVDVQTCEITSAADPVECEFTTDSGGTYTISSTVTDDAGRGSRSELTRWVSAPDAVPARVVAQEELTIVPDAAEYEPGATAELLVQVPFSTGSGLVLVSRNGIASTNRFDVTDGSAIVEVPIGDDHIPNVDVTIEVAGHTTRTADDGSPLEGDQQRPAFATGSITLPVSTASRSLTVSVTPAADQVLPGAATQVAVDVTDASGQPVAGSELAVVVVDEAVLALTGYTLRDPLSTFYGQLPSQLVAQYGRGSIILIDPGTFLRDGEQSGGAAATETTVLESGDTSVPAAAAPDFDDAKGAEEASIAVPNNGAPIDVRTNFDALAVFAPEITTDAAGHATIDVPLPDNLTRYRVMVVAVAGAQQFGSAEANITARLPLMVRPSAPRFLNFGDTFELPVVVQNQTDTPMDVDVVLQTTNLEPATATGKRVTVPANDRVEVRFPASAVAAGTAKFRVSAVSGDAADAAAVELPVYTPATAEAFATYGVVDDGAIAQPVVKPTGVIPQFGSLDVSTSSTSLQALTDAVLYLTDYPYESSDALASRILAIAALRDVLDAFDAPGLPSPAELNAAVDRDIAKLVSLQHGDGGFPYWSRSRPSEPYNSIQATHALIAARDEGYSVPQGAIDAALAYAADVESHYPHEYSQETRDTISAYALNVRLLAGDRDSNKAEGIWNDRGEDLALDAIAWIWPVIDDSSISADIARLIGNRAVDTAGAATFTTSVSDDAYVTLASDRRTDGLILDALIRLTPDSDLVPKVVNGLLAGQQQGRWDNVQENSFILLALKRYFDTYESQTPEFVARVWLGQQFAGEQQYSGRSTQRNVISIPTAQLLEIGDAGLTISKEGTGRLYYRIALRTAPSDLTLDPLDRGFVVQRTYEAVDDPSDVSRDADGTWRIKAGARVRVRLTMVAESQRTHVALVDPLPAGLEILNPDLAVTGDLPEDEGSDPGYPGNEDDGFGSRPVDFGWWWWPTWYDHQNMRDDRAEAFATYLGAGTYDYSYVARATTPGTFVTPPARAEEIYAPETFGRGSTDTVVVG